MRSLATTDEEKAFVEEMRDWFYSFVDYIVSEAEERYHLSALRKTIDSEKGNDKIRNALLDATILFIREGFEDQLYRLCHRHYLCAVWGGVSENCFTESSNSSLSRDALGPKPNHSIPVAAGAIVEHTEATHNKVKTGAVAEFHNSKMVVENETIDQEIARELSTYIIDLKNDTAMDQYELSKTFDIIEVDPKEIHFTSAVTEGDRTFLCRRQNMIQQDPDHRRPIYQRTREIIARPILIDGVDTIVLICGCGFFLHKLCPCRHIYSLLDRHPKQSDFFPCCFKTYEVTYGKNNPEYTRRCDVLTDQIVKFKGLLLPCRINDIVVRQVKNNDIEWYLKCHGTVVDINKFSIMRAKIPEEGVNAPGNGRFPHIPKPPAQYPSSSGGKISAYDKYHPAFVTMIDQIKTKEQHEYYQQQTKTMLENLIRMGKPKTSQTQIKDGLVSLNPIEKSGSKKRQAPHGSPTRYNKK